MSLPDDLFDGMHTNCIYCKNKYYTSNNTKVDLGSIYPSLFLDSPAQTSLLKKEKLALAECPKCSFVQLTNILEPDAMYRKYWYRSGLNNSMVKSLEDIVIKTTNKAAFRFAQVMDIGCNDGTLLSFYPEEYFKVGYDPANNLANSAVQNCDVFVNHYFNDTISYKHPFDIITSIAMFYDLEDPRQFIRGILKYLAPLGVWVIQMTDLTCTLKVNAYDNICHEHLAYYTLKHLKNLLVEYGLEIFDVEYNDVNGGSVRVYIAREDTHQISYNVNCALIEEENLLQKKDWKEFNRIIQGINKATVDFVKEANSKGEKVLGLGASTKGNTLLQVCGLNDSHIPCIMEVSKDKFGKYCAGSNIPIVSEAEGFAMKPDYLLVLPWHFTNFFLEKKLNYLKSGGKLLVPMPQPGIWEYSDNTLKFTSLNETIK